MKTNIIKIGLIGVITILLLISGKAFSQAVPESLIGKTKAEVVQLLRDNNEQYDISDGITADGEFYYIKSINQIDKEVQHYYFLTHEIDFCVAIKVSMYNRDKYKSLEKKWQNDTLATEGELNVFNKGGYIIRFDGYTEKEVWQYHYLIEDTNEQVVNAFSKV